MVFIDSLAAGWVQPCCRLGSALLPAGFSLAAGWVQPLLPAGFSFAAGWVPSCIFGLAAGQVQQHYFIKYRNDPAEPMSSTLYNYNPAKMSKLAAGRHRDLSPHCT